MISLFKKNKKQNKGFTTIELIISSGLFAVLIVAVTGVLLSTVSVNRQANLIKGVMNDIDFALENMMRTIRTGKDYDCGSDGAPKNCPMIPSSRMSLTDQYPCRVTYELEDFKIKRTISGNVTCNERGEGFITSSDVKITRLDFYVFGVDEVKMQPAVLVIVSGEMKYRDQTASFSVESFATQRLFNK